MTLTADMKKAQTKNHGRLPGAKLISSKHGKARIPFVASKTNGMSAKPGKSSKKVGNTWSDNKPLYY